jgi:hypothetical protein
MLEEEDYMMSFPPMSLSIKARRDAKLKGKIEARILGREV